jgi:hypothetical protein
LQYGTSSLSLGFERYCVLLVQSDALSGVRNTQPLG